MPLLDRLDPGGGVALKAIAYAGDLVIARGEEAALVPGVVEAESFQLLEGVGLESQEGGHRVIEPLADDGFEAGAYDDFFGALPEDLEGLDVGVHVGDGDHPVQIVVAVNIGVRGQTELPPPALEEAAPEEVAHRDAVRFAMAQRLVHALELGQAIGAPLHRASVAPGPGIAESGNFFV